jgi:hypothetical protein
MNSKQSYLLSVKPPPTSGLIIDDTPKTIPKNDWNIGRFRRGMSGMVIMIPPVTSIRRIVSTGANSVTIFTLTYTSSSHASNGPSDYEAS